MTPVRTLRGAGFGRGLLGVFALALLVRLLHLEQVRKSPYFGMKLLDAASYDAWARRLAAGDWLGSDVFYQAPLYPYFLGLLYATVGDSVLLVHLAQALLSAAACVLLADAGRHFFSPAAGIAAGGILALYAPAIFLDGLIQKSALDAFLLCLALCLVGRGSRRGSPGPWGAAGAVLGLLVLVRENALVFLPAILAALALDHRLPRRRRARLATVFLAAAAAVLAPVALRNLAVGGEFHLTTSQFGPNLYIGNNPEARGTYRPLRAGRGDPEYERRDATDLAQRDVGRALGPGEVSRYWTGRAVSYVVSQPGHWLRLVLRKLVLLFNATELADAEDQYSYAQWSWPLRLAGRVFHLGALAPAALLGLLLSRRDAGRLRPLYFMASFYAGSVVLFYVFARYRYPLVPFLVLFAAAGAVGALAAARRASRRDTAAVLAVVGAAAVFCNWPLHYRARMAATTHINLGNELAARGRPDDAIRAYRHALESKPTSLEANRNLGSVLFLEGRIDEAIAHYRRALLAVPGSSVLQSGLDEAQRAREQREAASRELALALAASGHPRRAAERYAELLAPGTEIARLHLELGRELAARGELEPALAQWRVALEEKPDWAPALSEVALVLATHPDPARRDPAAAIGLAERAVVLTRRERPRVLAVLASVLAAAGRYAEAVATAREALALAEGTPRAAEIREAIDAYERAGRAADAR